MNLKAYRLNAGIGVPQLAAHVGLSPDAIYKYERTGSRPRDAAKAKQIADLFGVQVTEIWPVEPATPAAV